MKPTAMRAPVGTAVVFMLALNLRPAVTSLGAALEDVSTAPGMTAVVGAVLVALPLWASGIGGWGTPWLRARWGIHRTVTWALVALSVTLILRVLGGPAALLAGTTLACLAIAVIGTVLPVLVRSSSSRARACYTLALGCGSTVGALVTPTVVHSFSWQLGLMVWALLAAVTANMWQHVPPDQPAISTERVLSPLRLFHSSTARALTFYFGLVSTLTFLVMGWLPAILRDAGVSAAQAGFCLALSMAMGLPMMWAVPYCLHRWRHKGVVVVMVAVPNTVGVIGLLVAPATAPWAWSIGLGLGMGGLALALTAITLRAGGDPDVTTALSAMVQGVGYLLAGVGALACGLLHSITGTWQAPLTMILVILCGQVCTGLMAVRPVVVRPGPAVSLPSVPLPQVSLPPVALPPVSLPDSVPLPRPPIETVWERRLPSES